MSTLSNKSLRCPYCGEFLKDGKCSNCKKDFSEHIKEIETSKSFSPDQFKTNDDILQMFICCDKILKTINTICDPFVFFSLQEVLMEYMSKIEECYSGNIKKYSEEPIFTDKDISFFNDVKEKMKVYIDMDSDTVIDFINRCISDADSIYKKELLFFKFSFYIDSLDVLPIVRLNEFFWLNGLWNDFDIGKKYRHWLNNKNTILYKIDEKYRKWNHVVFYMENERKEKLKNSILNTGIDLHSCSDVSSQNLTDTTSFYTYLVTSEEFLKLWDDLRSVDRSGCYIILSYGKKKDIEDFLDYNSIYIGQSEKVFNRVRNHLTGHGNGDVYCDVRNGDTVYVKIIYCWPYELNSLEKKLIDLFDATSSYNKTSGGATIR